MVFSWLKGKKELTIKANVQADVYIDGRYIGRTPLTVKVSEGKHRLRVVRDGYHPVEKEVVVENDRTLTFELKTYELNELKKYDLRWRYETGGIVNSVAITPDGKYIVAGSDDKKSIS